MGYIACMILKELDGGNMWFRGSALKVSLFENGWLLRKTMQADQRFGYFQKPNFIDTTCPWQQNALAIVQTLNAPVRGVQGMRGIPKM